MRAANNNRRRGRYTITVESQTGSDEYLVSILKGGVDGETWYSERYDNIDTVLAYTKSMARHLRCPVVHLNDHRRRHG